MSQTPSKSRNWCFTLNNYSAAELTHFDSLNLANEGGSIVYCLVGEEVGEGGTPHLQGFIVFKNAVRLPTVKSTVGARAHVERAKGTVKQNYDYCSKDGKYREFGDRPQFNEEKGAREKARYKRAFELAKLGDLDALVEESPDIAIRHYGTFKKIRHDHLTARKLEDTNEQMEWYYGEPGTGKSYKARSENPDAYLKNCNKWWDGYVDQDVVIVEDFDERHSVLVHYMKLWADRYPFLAEIKGSSQKIRPRKIIVTSNYHPTDIWTAKTDIGPILRRFKVTKFSEPFAPQPNPLAGGNEEVIDLTQ